MDVVGLQSVLYGVADLGVAKRFWFDFGLALVHEAPGTATLRTPEGATVVLSVLTDPALPPAPVAGPTVRRITWAVRDAAALNAIARELRRDATTYVDPQGRVFAVDPAGHAIAFEVSSLRPAAVAPTPSNAPGSAARVNARAAVYPRARPLHMAHVMFAVHNLEETAAFYGQRLGFRTTDVYTGSGVFLRAAGARDHHNLFLQRRDDAAGFHHIAFDLRDIHELFGGGLFMSQQGWKTHIGPGRHPVSSAYFWYFKNPCGGAAEYDFDADVADDAWVPREFDVTPDSFAEWAFPDGAGRYAGMQTGKV